MDFTLYINEFLVVAFAMFIALLSPGPDFAFVLKQSITYGKKSSVWASVGIGLGISVHVVYTLLGIGLIISKSIILFNIVKFLGAAYLIYLGYKSLRSRGMKLEDITVDSQEYMSNTKSFWLGFLCNALNPKATLFFVSLFTVVVDIKTPMMMQSLYGIFCIIATMMWFIMLSLILSTPKVRAFFNAFGVWFDRFVGIVLISLGLKIALSKN